MIGLELFVNKTKPISDDPSRYFFIIKPFIVLFDESKGLAEWLAFILEFVGTKTVLQASRFAAFEENDQINVYGNDVENGFGSWQA